MLKDEAVILQEEEKNRHELVLREGDGYVRVEQLIPDK